MNKSELIEHIARQADISKAAAGRALESVVGGIKSTLKKNGSVTLVGFGTFSVRQKGRRIGRNPKTGVEVPILPRRVLTFRPSQVLKAHVNGTSIPAGDDE